MEQSHSSEANSHSDNLPPLEPILTQMNQAHVFKSRFFKIRFIIILPSTPTSTKWSLPFRISD